MGFKQQKEPYSEELQRRIFDYPIVFSQVAEGLPLYLGKDEG